MSKKEMPERIWLAEDRPGLYDLNNTFPFEHEYRRIPSLPDVMEDGDTVWRVGSAFIRVEIHNGEFPAYEFTNDHGRRPLTITSELAEFLGLPTLKLQNNQIVKVEG